jgi:hypothetical protein
MSKLDYSQEDVHTQFESALYGKRLREVRDNAGVTGAAVIRGYQAITRNRPEPDFRQSVANKSWLSKFERGTPGQFVTGAELKALIAAIEPTVEARDRLWEIIAGSDHGLRNDSTSTKYGLRMLRSISRWQVLDRGGALRRLQRIEGLKVEPGVVLPYVQGRSRHSTPGSSIREKLTLTDVSDFPKKVSFVVDEDSDANVFNWRLVIAGSLTEHDPPLSYSLSSSFNNAILMSNEAVARAYGQDIFKYDYVSGHAETPTESIELDISFPSGVSVEYYPGVFWGPKEWFFHDAELLRVRSGFKVSESRATFVIAKPIVGFRYFIYWSFR